eukprot:3211846-Rhodomonas_salina.4
MLTVQSDGEIVERGGWSGGVDEKEGMGIGKRRERDARSGKQSERAAHSSLAPPRPLPLSCSRVCAFPGLADAAL